MPARQPEIDLSFAPSSYWDFDALGLQTVSRIAGSERRARVESVLESEGLDGFSRLAESDPSVLAELLPDEDRRFLGSLHPKAMGGEFLPRLQPREVEIARIELHASVLADVIRVVARPTRRGIRYVVQDEYMDESGPYKQPFQYKQRPLSLGELIDLIDSSDREDQHEFGWGLVLPFFQSCIDYKFVAPEAIPSIVEVTSGYYPQLRDHYLRACEKEMLEMQRGGDGEEEEEDED